MALRTTDEKANFQRIARLLMCGGVTLLREVFDSIHSSANLPGVLSNPATVRQLNGARLTKPERDRIYLPSGGYGKSSDFDITLLFRLLRTICNMAPPITGWGTLPHNTDHTLVADLARIKYYRNSIYGHNQTMEIPDAEFVDLWREISEALVRIAGTLSNAKRDEWKKSIEKFLHDPLTPGAEKYVSELQSWYKKDSDVKEEVEKLTNEMKQMKIKEEQMNIMLEQLTLKTERMNLMLEQMIDIDITAESFKAGEPSISPGRLPNDPQPQESDLQYERGCVIHIPPDQQQEGQSTAGEVQTNQQELDLWYVLYSFKEPISQLVRYLRIKLGLEVRDNRLGSLVLTVSCSSLQNLEGLWEDYSSGHLSKVVQETLITTEVLKELCLSEVKLKTRISEEEYNACKEFFINRSGENDS